MTWAIVADSSCNLKGYEPSTPQTVYASAPLKINVGTTEYADDDTLDIQAFIQDMTSTSAATSSACPSVGEWAELLRSAENVIAIPISTGLSGSYDAASTACDMVMAEGGHNIHLLDSRAAGAKLEYLVVLIDRYLTYNPEATFEEVCNYADSIEDHSQVLYSLSTYDNLVKAGRFPKLAGLVANKLNIRMLGSATDQGTMTILGPSRGEKKSLAKILSAMEDDGFDGGDVFIDHVNNETGAQKLADMITTAHPTTTCHIMPCRALCSYYAELNGLIIGYGCSSPWS